MFPSHAESIAATVKNRDINIHISGFRGKDKSDSTQLVGNKCKVPSLPISLRASCFIDDNNNGIYEALLCHRAGWKLQSFNKIIMEPPYPSSPLC